MNFLDFINNKKILTNNVIVEDFKKSDTQKALDLIYSALSKGVKGKLLVNSAIINKVAIDNKPYFSITYYHIVDNFCDVAFTLNWKANERSLGVYSISFAFADEAQKILWHDDHLIKTYTVVIENQSVAKFIPYIIKVINAKSMDVSEVMGSLEYHCELVTEDTLVNFTKTIQEEANNLEIDIDGIEGAKQGNHEEKIQVKFKNTNFKYKDTNISEVEKEVEGKLSPKERFEMMEIYLEGVVNKTNNGLIICGAPGIGKTFRVQQYLKKQGYKDGYTMHIVKGKLTSARLYIELYRYRRSYNILVIDDADSVVGPKADETAINILKAALDSTQDEEGRKISYLIKGDIEDEYGNKIPHEFYYKGGVIVLTNYSIGQLNTAIRGRVFTQTLDFTNKELLEIIKDIMPNVMPDVLSMESKEKAYAYMEKLVASNSPMTISIRSFGFCAQLYETLKGKTGISEQLVETMIKEQLANQAKEGGRSF